MTKQEADAELDLFKTKITINSKYKVYGTDKVYTVSEFQLIKTDYKNDNSWDVGVLLRSLNEINETTFSVHPNQLLSPQFVLVTDA